MKLATYEIFVAEDDMRWGTTNQTNPLQESRNRALNDFKYTAIIEGLYPENDFATRWCWQQFGPMDTTLCCEHSSEYPGCPLVLAIEEYVIKKSYTDKEGVVHEYNFHTRDPGTHSHDGCWTIVWLGKTGYNYGFMEFYFANEKDRDAFVKAVPSFGLGENYED